MKLVERYRKLVSVRIEMSELTETFKKRVKRHLIHDDLDYEALTVANGGRIGLSLVLRVQRPLEAMSAKSKAKMKVAAGISLNISHC